MDSLKINIWNLKISSSRCSITRISMNPTSILAINKKQRTKRKKIKMYNNKVKQNNILNRDINLKN